MNKTNRCLKAKDEILNILEKEEITLDEFNNISKDIATEYVEKAVFKPKEILEINLESERIINMVKNAKSISFDELASEISIDKALKGVCVFIVDSQGNNIGYIMVNEELEVIDRLEKGYKVNGE